MRYSTAAFRKGLKIEISGEPFVIVDFQHVKPGKGGAFVRTKLKSLVRGSVLDKTFRSGEKVDVPDLEQRCVSFLYKDGSNYYFMDNNTYEQISMVEAQIGEAVWYLKENTRIDVLFHNKIPIGMELPLFLELKVVETDPGVKGNTASGGSKPAGLETGAAIQVPLFINEGDMVRVNTKTGEYMERAG